MPQLRHPQQDVRLRHPQREPGGGAPASTGEPGGANKDLFELPPQITDADRIRSRIATLERALAALQLDLSVDDPEDELSWLNLRVIDDGEDDEDSEDDLGGPRVTIKSLVMAGLAKKIPGGDSVSPGAV